MASDNPGPVARALLTVQLEDTLTGSRDLKRLSKTAAKANILNSILNTQVDHRTSEDSQIVYLEAALAMS